MEDVRGDAQDMRRSLIPMLRADLAPSRKKISAWTEKLVTECRDLLSAVLPLSMTKMKFIRRLNDMGEIAPELLTADATIQAVIRDHPGLRWKMLNVRTHHDRHGPS